jgi:iron complex transport system substrate-binding protein
VCAVSPKDIGEALAACDPTPDVLELESLSLEGVFQDIFRVATALDAVDAAKSELFRQWAIMKQVRARVAPLRRRRVAVVDWLDPLMFAGNWVPELVSAAGGESGLVERGKPSRWGTWDELRDYAPEAIVLAPCGIELTQTLDEWRRLATEHDLQDVPAVASRRIFAADGHSFFNRPGPRLVYSAALLARAIHPEVPALPEALESAMAPVAA